VVAAAAAAALVIVGTLVVVGSFIFPRFLYFSFFGIYAGRKTMQKVVESHGF
jgi:hypothetical protein